VNRSLILAIGTSRSGRMTLSPTTRFACFIFCRSFDLNPSLLISILNLTVSHSILGVGILNMPPKKRKAAAAAATVISDQPSKKVRIGDASNIDQATEASPSGRHRRSTSNEKPQYNFTRKRGAAKAEENSMNADTASTQNGEMKRGRGRPRKTLTPEPEKATTARRGILKNGKGKAAAGPSKTSTPTRPNIRAAGGPTASAAKRRSSVSNQSPPASAKKAATSAAKKRGRAAAKKTTTKDLEASVAKADDAITNGVIEAVDKDVQYWLMKAEPESRMEKGIDVKFSIDDLASRTEPEGWDGKASRHFTLI
jgi:hypothetical protein